MTEWLHETHNGGNVCWTRTRVSVLRFWAVRFRERYDDGPAISTTRQERFEEGSGQYIDMGNHCCPKTAFGFRDLLPRHLSKARIAEGVSGRKRHSNWRF